VEIRRSPAAGRGAGDHLAVEANARVLRSGFVRLLRSIRSIIGRRQARLVAVRLPDEIERPWAGALEALLQVVDVDGGQEHSAIKDQLTAFVAFLFEDLD